MQAYFENSTKNIYNNIKKQYLHNFSLCDRIYEPESQEKGETTVTDLFKDTEQCENLLRTGNGVEIYSLKSPGLHSFCLCVYAVFFCTIDGHFA